MKSTIREVDSYRFLERFTRMVVRSWITMEAPRPIPWTPPERPLAESRVALISSGGIALKDDRPFDQEGERRNPWWGDPSYRVLPAKVTSADIRLYHLHVDPQYAEEDLNCLLPAGHLLDLARQGEIGGAASQHYSFMGYTVQPDELLEVSTPRIIEHLREDRINLVVLIPA